MGQVSILLQTLFVVLTVLKKNLIRHLSFLRLSGFYKLYTLVDPNSHQLLKGGGFCKLVSTYAYRSTVFLYFAELQQRIVLLNNVMDGFFLANALVNITSGCYCA